MFFAGGRVPYNPVVVISCKIIVVVVMIKKSCCFKKEWNNDFYEVDTVRENQLFFGRNNNYNVSSYASSYGESVSIIVDCHLTRADRVGIAEVR